MPLLPLARGAYERGQGPDVPLLNMFFEQDPRNIDTQAALLPRPGISLFATCGSGPIRAIFRQEGVLGGVFLVVSGTSLYKVTTGGTVTQITGTISGTGRCSIAGTASIAYIANGTALYSTTGSGSITTVSFPDSAGVTAVGVINGYILFVRASSQRFYWLTPGSSTIDGLDYASAENAPDDIEGMSVLSDEVLFFGKATIEAWTPTGDPDLPLLRVGGRLFGVGCTNRDTICRVGDAVFWVGEDKDAGGRAVWQVADRPQKASDNAIDQKLRLATAANLRAWSFSQDGHAFYVLSTGSETLVYDLTTNIWTEFVSPSLSEWRAHLGAPRGDGRVIGGDSANGKLWLLDADISTDDSSAFERQFSGRVQRAGAPLPMANLVLDCTVGSTASGDPTVDVATSEDEGRTWTSWRSSRLGTPAEYTRWVAWRRFRPIRRHREFKFRVTADVKITVKGAEINASLR